MTQGTLPLARTSDPMPSHLAASSVKKTTVARSHEAVLGVLRVRPMAAWEAEQELAHLPLSPSRIRSAFAELERQGLIEVTGEGVSPFGRPARVWSLA